MTVRSIRILCQLDFPSKTHRLWDGSGPFLDLDGKVWRGMVLRDGLDVIESAMNGEAYSLALGLSGVTEEASNMAYKELQSDDIIGAKVQLMIQDCDQFDQPVGAPDVRFTGLIDNIVFSEAVEENSRIASIITIECTNRFSLRNSSAGSVLSDADQKARSAKINPLGTPDRFAERVPTLADKAIWWPRFT